MFFSKLCLSVSYCDLIIGAFATRTFITSTFKNYLTYTVLLITLLSTRSLISLKSTGTGFSYSTSNLSTLDSKLLKLVETFLIL